MRLAIAVDLTLCEGNAICCRVAPQVFELDDSVDQVRLLATHVPGDVPDAVADAVIDRVRKAARGCPRQAISLSEEP
jgi:ferredoxin